MRVQVKQTPTLVLWALLAAACSSSAGSADMSTGDGGGLRDCTGCRADQVCSDGTCRDVPAKCPCPKETFCDLTSSTCKRGCTDDVNCSSGKYCDTGARMCMAGCKMDENCNAGSICEAQQCVAGCRKDATCGGAGKICDAATSMCRPGCRKAADCMGGSQTCDVDTATCVPGCTKKSDCAAGKTCDVAFNQCVTQCAAGNNSACADNQACVRQPDATYGCSANCRITNCKGTRYTCFGDEAQINKMRCRVTCRDSADCASEEACASFRATPGAPIPAFLCAKKCAVAGCAAAISLSGGMCTCSGATNMCMDSMLAGLPCVQSDPSYGL